MASRETLLKILDLARWAPSGDNTQPWRFEIAGDDHLVVHGSDTRDWCLYDFNGHASHMAHGALLETLRIAATGEGLVASWTLRPGSPDTAPVFDVRLEVRPGLAPDQLHQGRDLLHTTDFRDVLGEIVSVHLGNPNIKAVLPNHQFKDVGLVSV